MTKISERELLNIVDQGVKNSIGQADSTLSHERNEAMEYYLGEAKGKLAPSEVADSSQVVSRDVADTVEWIMPSLMRIFTGGEDVVSFEPVGAEDMQLADQATDWCNYVFNKKNSGFLILHNWFKDALLQKLGVVKTWWDESEDVTTESYQGVSMEEITLLMEDESVEIIEQELNEDGEYDIKLAKTEKRGQIRTENVPPEEFLFNREAKSAEDLTFAAHRLERTVSELREAGYKNVDDLMGDESGAEYSEETTTRFDDQDAFSGVDDDTSDETMRKVWVTEAYLKVDWDGDGIAEWRKVLKCGRVLLDNEECDGHPFDIITPILMPHRMVGISIADQVKDLQEIKTALLRQMLDNMYLTNNPRLYVDENKNVNIDDLLDARIGGLVRGRGDNGVVPIATHQMSPQNFSLMEYVDGIRENRTGVTRYNQGLDANSLNKTASGINAIMGASQQRIELIARVLAETGVKDLFKRYLKLSSKYESEQQIIRLRGKYVQIDPRAWNTQYDITVSVGVGTGNREQQVGHLMNVLGIQKEALMAGLPIVSPKHIYNTTKRLVESVGFKDGDMFFQDPDSPEAKQEQQQKAQQPNPEMVKAQQDAQLKQAEMQQEGQIEQRKLQAQQQQTIAELQAKLRMKEMEIKSDQQIAAMKAQADTQTKMEIAQITSKPNTTIALGGEEVGGAVGAMLQQMSQQSAELMQMMMQNNNNQTQQLQQSIETMAGALTAPKRAVYDDKGNIIGSEVVVAGNA